MNSSIQYELQLMGLSMLTGGGLMMVYDCFRVLRIVIPHKTLLTGVEDLGYWIFAAFVTFALLYRLNDGGLRGYAITGVFLSMFVYDRLISRFFLKLLKKLVRSVKIQIKKHKKQKKQDSKAGES